MSQIYIISFILSTLIVPQVMLLEFIRGLDLKLFQFLTFANIIANNVYVYVISLILFTFNLILPY